MFFYYLDLAWRSIKKTPFLSLLMVLAISIGIGITITTLNIYKMASVNPAGERSSQLFSVQLMSQDPDTWQNISEQITYQDAINLRKSEVPIRQTAMFRTGLAVQTEDVNFSPILEGVRVADSDFFAIFDVPFLYGSPWSKQVDSEGGYKVVISEDLNTKAFGGTNSVGKTLILDRKPYQVVGVIKNWNPSPKYYDVNNGAFNESEQIFVPFSLAPIEEFNSWGNNNSWRHENIRNYNDRLNSEMHWVQYWTELSTPAMQQEYKLWLGNYVEQQQQLGRFKHPEARGEISDVATWMVFNNVVPEDNKVLVGLSVLFLVVCLVNMLGLLLAKFLKRAPEVGVRRAIGASRMQIFSQHLVEVGLIGFCGGVLGLAWAWGALSLLASKFDLTESLSQLDQSMWLIAPVIAVSAAIIAGVYPAWRICTTNPSIYLKSQ
ncbi:ABC transporter, ATP-binding protein [Shewanella piezotolerans WP3]|uniref:ABC transporter, ATP-binding protein n=1 Tax=Shewanella piezotolerans (strain WP3 / JCM 13877) TaxID=225849 RepID=B8CJ80_SHEPW|nr:ABC transporter permease [Shewanella piezotolerans]ACJ27842.1 ABC transporter, ATP-binding protein [Shewanella piezotolerans WP3]